MVIMFYGINKSVFYVVGYDFPCNCLLKIYSFEFPYTMANPNNCSLIRKINQEEQVGLKYLCMREVIELTTRSIFGNIPLVCMRDEC